MEKYQKRLDEYGEAFSKVFDAAAEANLPFEQLKKDLSKKRNEVMLGDIFEAASLVINAIRKSELKKEDVEEMLADAER